jgi:hypothetical protein
VAVDALDDHLATYGQLGPPGIVSTGDRGGPLNRGELSAAWRMAVAAVPVAPVGLHVHDLRHSPATMMARMQASPPRSSGDVSAMHRCEPLSSINMRRPSVTVRLPSRLPRRPGARAGPLVAGLCNVSSEGLT